MKPKKLNNHGVSGFTKGNGQGIRDSNENENNAQEQGHKYKILSGLGNK